MDGRPRPGPAARGGRPLPLWAAAPVAVISGFLLDLAYPSVGWWPLAFLSVIITLAALIGRSIGGALIVGISYGAAFMLTHLMWVAQFLGPVPWIALGLFEAVLIGAGSLLIAMVYRWSDRVLAGRWAQLLVVPVVVAAIWALREIVVGIWPYTGFPWARLGMSQSDSPFADVASWAGVTGLSFLMVLLCAAALQYARVARFKDLRTLLPVALLGAVLLLLPRFPTTPAGEMQIGWVQGNGPSAYFDEREAGEIFAAQAAATRPLLGQGMDLLVWPEGSVDSDPLTNRSTAAELDELARAANAPLLVNAATSRDGATYNTSLLWEKDGGTPQLHDKVNPVPFGEYVPDRWFYQLLAPELVSLIQREYTPGTNPPYMAVGERGIGLAICFDVIYDDVIWQGAQLGAEVFIFQTNNGDFRGTDENLQQLAFARMRAIETGRAVVNVSTTGTSQAIGADGSILEELQNGHAGARVSVVPLQTGLTPAVVIGPWLTPALSLGAIAAVIALAVTHRRRGTLPAGRLQSADLEPDPRSPSRRRST
ncbi:MAG: apolipoprotein N-acyltransferase [Micrococcales bacterium 73-13]|nr:MAG: apolipoprotein N-acyltransferase [Micrococcales bacterium 73-13]